MTGDREIRLDDDPALPVAFGAGRLRQQPGERAPATPAAHTFVRTGIRSRSPSRGWTSIAPSSMPTTVVRSIGVTPSERSCFSALADSRSENALSTRSPASTAARAPPGVDLAVLLRQDVARELGNLARHLDAGRAGADDGEREPRPPGFLVGLELGRLEREQDLVTQIERAVERLQLRRVLPSPRARSTSSSSRPRRRACRR